MVRSIDQHCGITKPFLNNGQLVRGHWAPYLPWADSVDDEATTQPVTIEHPAETNNLRRRNLVHRDGGRMRQIQFRI